MTTHAVAPPIAGYVHRAAALVLVWSELLDDVGPAEACAGHAELVLRRDALRRELRAHLDRSDLGGASDKWVQRAFWSAPPRRGVLDEKWREPLMAFLDVLDLGAEAAHDCTLATRALFVHGEADWAELVARRPGLLEALARAIDEVTPTAEPIRDVAVIDALEDGFLPVYLTDADVTRVVWSNRSLQALLGFAPDAITRMGFAGLLERFTSMIPPVHLPHFQERQEQILVAGRSIGHGYISTVIDLSLRSWTHGLATPPWEGVYRIESHAHFVIDRKTGERRGSLVVMVPRRLEG